MSITVKYMEKMWAPWRMEFIEGRRSESPSSKCLFCDLAKTHEDRKELILFRGDQSYVVMNRFPYNNGHLMLVPYDHGDDVRRLPTQARGELLWLLGASIEILTKALGAEGFNSGVNVGRVAGAGILDHFHLHLVPRWQGDTNFLPVLGETKALPEYLEQTYERVLPRFAQLKVPGGP